MKIFSKHIECDNKNIYLIANYSIIEGTGHRVGKKSYIFKESNCEGEYCKNYSTCKIKNDIIKNF